MKREISFDSQWLILFFREELQMIVASDFEQKKLCQLSVEYTPATPFGGSTGHYDWLRTTDRQIVGIRYWPFDDACHRDVINALVKAVSSKSYSSVDRHGKYFEIFFGNHKHIDEGLSNDQDLGDNGICVNGQGEYLMYFELDLNACEVSSLIRESRQSQP